MIMIIIIIPQQAHRGFCKGTKTTSALDVASFVAKISL